MTTTLSEDEMRAKQIGGIIAISLLATSSLLAQPEGGLADLSGLEVRAGYGGYGGGAFVLGVDYRLSDLLGFGIDFGYGDLGLGGEDSFSASEISAAAALYATPQGEAFQAFGTLGVARTGYKYTHTTWDLSTGREVELEIKDSDTSLLFGAGIKYDFNESLRIDASVKKYGSALFYSSFILNAGVQYELTENVALRGEYKSTGIGVHGIYRF